MGEEGEQLYKPFERMLQFGLEPLLQDDQVLPLCQS